MDLYGLLPAAIRYYDRQSSGKVGLNTEETTLQKILYAVEQEADATDVLISGLKDLLDADNCQEEFLSFLSKFLGVSFFSSWPEGRKRIFIKALVKLYHISGQNQSWNVILNLLDYSGASPYELWKEEIYEDFDYSRYGPDDGDYYGTLHAARVDVDAADGTRLNETLTTQEKVLLDNFRPIHVLIRQLSNEVVDKSVTLQSIDSDDVDIEAGLLVQETLEEISDVCTVDCESHCEAVCEAGHCEGTFEFSTTCLSGCEVACEVGNEPVAVVDSGTGDAVILTIVSKKFYNVLEVLYTGTIAVVVFATGSSVTLDVVHGIVYQEGGVVVYTGIVSVTDFATGSSVKLGIVSGLISIL